MQTERKIIEEFLGQRHLPFVGVSRDTKQFANAVYRPLQEGGRTLYPVNASAGGSPLEGDGSIGAGGDGRSCRLGA